ncbi:SPOR domain-containing protein [Brevirhabdus sp.]|uniref:SPOR domain-containing protein n=1 Tax=Brevirhabdus sp. TaxID=2004514 RepID=UPI004059DEC8
MADVQFNAFDSERVESTGITASFVNLTGAALSVGLVAGLGVWGYNLTVRDVAEVPVIRALAGPMRVQPENPGGEQAAHQGLSINGLQAAGEAAAPADRLVLAPRPVDLSTEDAVTRPVQVAEARMPTTDARTASDLPVDDALRLDAPRDGGMATVPMSSAGAVKAAMLTADADAAPQAGMQINMVSVEAPGLRSSERPSPRRDYVRTASLDTRTDAAAIYRAVAEAQGQGQAQGQNEARRQAKAQAQADEIDPATLKRGTRLVQLGAFDSTETAKAEWARISGSFGTYMDGKQRVIQKATSGGRTFYRLRVAGFDGLSDSRRFCSVLLAGKTACIPVVAR